MTRSPKGVWLIATLLVLAGSLCVGGAFAQDKSLKDQVVGAWTLVSFESFDAAGTKGA